MSDRSRNGQPSSRPLSGHRSLAFRRPHTSDPQPPRDPPETGKNTRRPDVLPRLGAGEPGAAEECLERYGALVWSLARGYTRDASEAEDAVQEVFLNLWKNASRFDPTKAPESAFVSLVARRRLIDLYRRSKRLPQIVDAEPELETVPDLRSAAAEIRVEARLTSRVLDQLSRGEREAVLMSIYLGMSHSEIARRINSPLGTVKSRIRRGLMRARETLEERDPGAK